VRAFGGPRYAVAFGVDALGSGMLRPFLLLYGVKVLSLSAPATGVAMTVGIVAGLFVLPRVGRWVDRGARSSAAAAAMAVRAVGVAVLLSASPGQLWRFVAAAFFLGVGNRAFPTAHGAVIATVATGRDRDAALAAGRSLTNAGLGFGALIAAATLAGGAPALRGLAAATGAAYLLAALLAWSVRIRAVPGPDRTGRSSPGDDEPAPRMGVLLAANVVFTFCLNVPEIALPLILTTRLHASPVWAAAVFILNTVLVVALQVPVTVWMARFSRRGALALSGVVLTLSYLGFLAAVPLGRTWGAPVVVAVSVVCTLGEIVYAGSATPLVAAIAPPDRLGRALARFQLSTGFGLAVSPAVITALGATGPALLWGTLAITTFASAAAVAR
jgi:MFS family permease